MNSVMVSLRVVGGWERTGVVGGRRAYECVGRGGRRGSMQVGATGPALVAVALLTDSVRRRRGGSWGWELRGH